MVRFATKLT